MTVLAAFAVCGEFSRADILLETAQLDSNPSGVGMGGGDPRQAVWFAARASPCLNRLKFSLLGDTWAARWQEIRSSMV